MAKILVTGGAGFIGSNLVDELIRQGEQVVVIDSLVAGKKDNVNPQAIFYQADIRHSEEIKEIFAREKFDVVFHLAAQIDVNTSVNDPVLDAAINIWGTLNILEACRREGVKKVIFPSSAAVYGDTEIVPTPEDAPLEPLSPYGISKLTVEKYLDFYYQIHKLPYLAFRFSNVYGPRQYKGGEGAVTAIFTHNAVHGLASKLYGDGEQTRDFIFVGDICQACLAALRTDKIGVYNISANQTVSINQLIKTIEAVSGQSFPVSREAARPGDIRHSRLKADKANRELGWQTQVDLAEGIARTLEWAKGQAG